MAKIRVWSYQEASLPRARQEFLLESALNSAESPPGLDREALNRQRGALLTELSFAAAGIFCTDNGAAVGGLDVVPQPASVVCWSLLAVGGVIFGWRRGRLGIANRLEGSKA